MRALLAAALLGLACQHSPEAPRPAAAPPLERAAALIDAGEPAKAIPILDALRAQEPANLDAARLSAEAHVKAGRGAELLARTERSAAGSAADSYARGLVLFATAADATPEAVAAMRRAIELAPGAAELHYRLGLMLLEAEQYPEALPALDRAATLEPKRPAFQLPLARAKARTGDRAGAVEALRRLVGLGPSAKQLETARAVMASLSDPFAVVPKAARARVEQALQWLDSYDVPQQAIVELESALRDFPDLAIAHALLGLAYQRLDDAGHAVEEFRRAIELAPEHGRFHYYLAGLYLQRQRPDQARGELERAVALDPLLDDAHLALGDLAAERRELDVARRHVELAVALRPDATRPRVRLAAVHQLEGDLQKATEVMNEALALQPDNVELQLGLGLLNVERSRAGKTKAERDAAAAEARRWLRKVLDAQPENAAASRALQSVGAQ